MVYNDLYKIYDKGVTLTNLFYSEKQNGNNEKRNCEVKRHVESLRKKSNYIGVK